MSEKCNWVDPVLDWLIASHVMPIVNQLKSNISSEKAELCTLKQDLGHSKVGLGVDVRTIPGSPGEEYQGGDGVARSARQPPLASLLHPHWFHLVRSRKARSPISSPFYGGGSVLSNVRMSTFLTKRNVAKFHCLHLTSVRENNLIPEYIV
jgi:hypothetical protein